MEISGILAIFTFATMRDAGAGVELLLTFTIGFLRLIFGRSGGGGATNSGSGRVITVKTTQNPATTKAAAWKIRLMINPLGAPLFTLPVFLPYLFFFITQAPFSFGTPAHTLRHFYCRYVYQNLRI
jgi:hypothetical protein